MHRKTSRTRIGMRIEAENALIPVNEQFYCICKSNETNKQIIIIMIIIILAVMIMIIIINRRGKYTLQSRFIHYGVSFQ